MDFYCSPNLNKNQILNMVAYSSEDFPTQVEVGQIFYHIYNKKLYVLLSTGWQSLAFGTNEGVPQGLIVAYYGTNGDISSIPPTWALCDGAPHLGIVNPDLRDKFIKCIPTSVTSSPFGTGGSATHFHSITDHTHTFNVNITSINAARGDNLYSGGNAGIGDMHSHGTGGNVLVTTTSTVVPTNTSGASSNPEYCELAFIIKLAP